jgi:hypothetical protein
MADWPKELPVQLYELVYADGRLGVVTGWGHNEEGVLLVDYKEIDQNTKQVDRYEQSADAEFISPVGIGDPAGNWKYDPKTNKVAKMVNWLKKAQEELVPETGDSGAINNSAYVWDEVGEEWVQLDISVSSSADMYETVVATEVKMGNINQDDVDSALSEGEDFAEILDLYSHSIWGWPEAEEHVGNSKVIYVPSGGREHTSFVVVGPGSEQEAEQAVLQSKWSGLYDMTGSQDTDIDLSLGFTDFWNKWIYVDDPKKYSSLLKEYLKQHDELTNEDMFNFAKNVLSDAFDYFRAGKDSQLGEMMSLLQEIARHGETAPNDINEALSYLKPSHDDEEYGEFEKFVRESLQ